jgi:hypothetical protein
MGKISILHKFRLVSIWDENACASLRVSRNLFLNKN